METTQQRPTATILAFPAAKRAAAAILSRKAKFAAEVAALRSSPVAVSDAWYHQAAIDEGAGERKN